MYSNLYFRFKLEGESKETVIPQTVNDGSDTVSFASSWSKQNLPGSTEPIVAFNYADAPTLNINLKFSEDMWREAGLPQKGYLEAINKFASLVYPSLDNSDKGTIKSPYCLVYIDRYVYRGYFTNIRINQSGVIRNGYKTTCEITSSFVIIKKSSPIQNEVGNNFRIYFGD